MDRAAAAESYFFKGYSCCQAILLAFEDVTDAEQSVLLRIGSSFGGGLGGLRQTCGAVSAVAVILGLKEGFEQPDLAAKTAHYQNIRAALASFLQKRGTFSCKELLAMASAEWHPDPMERTPEYYKKRPCGVIVREVAAALQAYLESK